MVDTAQHRVHPTEVSLVSMVTMLSMVSMVCSFFYWDLRTGDIDLQNEAATLWLWTIRVDSGERANRQSWEDFVLW